MITAKPPLRPTTSALLFVDFQLENAPGEAWPVEGYDNMLGAAIVLLDAARRAGVHVIHVRTMRRGKANLAAHEPRLGDGRYLYGDATDPAAAFIPNLAPVVGETVIEKTASSAFAGTNLSDHLRLSEVRDLIVAGVWTEECILLTVKDAIALELNVWLAAEACASGSFSTHQAATAIMAMRLYGGGVVGTSNAIACLTGRAFHCFSPMLPKALFNDSSQLDALYAELVQAIPLPRPYIENTDWGAAIGDGQASSPRRDR